MNVTVAMPWRSTPERTAAHHRIRQFWHHAGIDVVEGDSVKHEAFSVAQARNNAVRKIVAELVIVADADTLPDLGALHQALTHLETHPRTVVWPFQTYRHIPASWVDKSDLMAAPADRVYHNSVGGLFCCHFATYWELGGMDEHFAGWGFDDNAFFAAAQTLASVSRTAGTVFSFNHPADRDTSANNLNRHRYELYKFATGRPHVMRQLIRK